MLKYPNSPLVPKAEQHLREVQEIIADGDYRVAPFLLREGPALLPRLRRAPE